MRVAILGGVRIPFARANGPYAHATNQQMLTEVLECVTARFGLQGARLGEVVGGAVLKHARDRDLTRESVLETRLSPETPAYDIQQACATGLETAIAIANKIALGQIDVGIACGVDSTSEAPLALNDELRRTLLEANRQGSAAANLRTLTRVRPRQLAPEIPRNAEPRTSRSMGEHCAQMARDWGVARAEQDELTRESHRHLAAAYERGFMDGLVHPYRGLEHDENLRPGLSVEQLAKLKPVFGGPAGTMTAGNSTPLSDGASAVLLANERWAHEAGIPVLAYLITAQTAAVDHVNGEGLLMAPVHGMPRMLERAGLTLQEFDFYEVHEAFAAQVLCSLKAWEDPAFCRERLGREQPLGAIDRAKLNVNGGSLAAGHPFAATGGRILASLAKQLADSGAGRGVISVCAAGGQGALAILQAAGDG